MSNDLLNNAELLIINDEVKNPHSKYSKLLDNVQGHILTDNGRDHSVHIFLKFKKADSAKIRTMIQQLACAVFPLENTLVQSQSFHYLPSTKEQLLVRTLVKNPPTNAKYKRTYFVNLYLTYGGYETLGFSKHQIPPGLSIPLEQKKLAPPHLSNRLLVYLKYLISQGKLSDEQFAKRDKQFDDIHAMIAIAHINELEVKGKRVIVNADPTLQTLIDAFQDYVVAVEVGKVLYDSDDQQTKEPIEHFGFRDGISVPVFFKEDWEKKRKQDIDQKVDKFDQAAPLRLALAEDPNCKKEDHAFGSYLIFGKLEQNVRAFEEDIQELAVCLEGNDPVEKTNRAGALVMGRFKDGTPIVLQGTAGGIRNKDGTVAGSPNNFLYTDDAVTNRLGAGRCPLQSHIRRANPRGEVDIILQLEKEHRIVRRGIPYGDRGNKEPKYSPSLKDLPSHGVGLLFMCFQADVGKQFEHIMDEWCLYEPHRDAVMRDNSFVTEKEIFYNNWPDRWYEDPMNTSIVSVNCIFTRQHVYFKGGEYFFAPSIKFLQNIANRG